MASPYRISIGVSIDASAAKAGSNDAKQAVASIGAEAEKAAPKIETAANAVRQLESVGGNNAAAASIDAIRASAVGAIPSMERLVNTFAGISTPASNDNGRVATLAAYAAELDRLQAKFDPVFAAQQRYQQNLAQINELERVGAITASVAIEARLREANAYDGLISKVERLGAARKSAAEAMVRQQTITPDRGADVEAYGRSLDQLRARYNPLYAAITQYKQAQLEIRNAHAVGAISADEMTAALSRQRQMTLSSIDAIKGRNRALADTPSVSAIGAGNHGFQTANLAFQAQDVAVTAAMGMHPAMIGLQQGMQMAPVIASMERPVAGLAAAFASLVSPVTLVTVGLTAGTAALIQYFMSVEDGASDASAALEGHTELIRRIREAYGEAAAGLKEYADDSDKLLRQDIVDRIENYKAAILETASALEGSLLSIPAENFDGATYTISEMQAALSQLSAGIQSGEPDLRAFVERLVDIENQKGTPEEIRKLIKELRESAAAGVTAQRALQPLVGVINGVGAAAASQAEQISSLSKAIRGLNGLSLPNLSALEQATELRDEALAGAGGATEAGVNQILGAYDRAIQRIRDTNPTVLNGDGREVSVPTPDDKPIRLGEAVSRSNGSAANSYRDLVKSADDRIAQMKLEAEMAGKVGIEADALRFQLDLLQRSEDKGRSITEAQRAAINERVEAFKEYAAAAATAKLKADLLWESEQAGRTWMDQEVAGRLRSAGLPIDFESYEAGLIRTNLALQSARDYAGDFAHTLFDGLEQGKGLWDSFADAGIGALKRLGRSLLDDVLNNIFSIKNAAGGSGGGGGGLFGWLGGLFGGGFQANTTLGAFLTKGFDDGGYTGPGGIHEPRGVVHAGEVVWSQRDVARAGGVDVVEAMRLGLAGYARGGAVDVQPMLPAGRSADQVAQASTATLGQLKILLGIASDGNLNLRPEVAAVVDERAPGIAIDIVEQNNATMPDQIAAYNENPNWRP